MPFVEQSTVIKAPLEIVMNALNDVKAIPRWATVSGTIENVQGHGPGMIYDWQYEINGLKFSGKSEVIEQTERTLITKTTGDIDSIWSINLTPTGKNSTAMNVLVEYSSPNIFIEILADIVLQQINDPEVAKENMLRFKKMVEERAKTAQANTIAN